METNSSTVEGLLQKAEQYGRTSVELLKLRSLDKVTEAASSLISRFVLAIVLSLFILTLNMALALWLGEVLGKHYFGFLVVAGFYGLFAIVLVLIHPWIKARLGDSIINYLTNRLWKTSAA